MIYFFGSQYKKSHLPDDLCRRLFLPLDENGVCCFLRRMNDWSVLLVKPDEPLGRFNAE